MSFVGKIAHHTKSLLKTVLLCIASTSICQVTVKRNNNRKWKQVSQTGETKGSISAPLQALTTPVPPFHVPFPSATFTDPCVRPSLSTNVHLCPQNDLTWDFGVKRCQATNTVPLQPSWVREVIMLLVNSYIPPALFAPFPHSIPVKCNVLNCYLQFWCLALECWHPTIQRLNYIKCR